MPPASTNNTTFLASQNDNSDNDGTISAASYYIAIIVIIIIIIVISVVVRLVHVKRRNKILRNLTENPVQTVPVENNPYWTTQRDPEAKLPSYIESTLGGVGNRVVAPQRAPVNHPAEPDPEIPDSSEPLPPPYDPNGPVGSPHGDATGSHSQPMQSATNNIVSAPPAPTSEVDLGTLPNHSEAVATNNNNDAHPAHVSDDSSTPTYSNQESQNVANASSRVVS